MIVSWEAVLSSLKKPEEEIIENGGTVDPNNADHWKVKARWCLQGHLDPDLTTKASAGTVAIPHSVSNGTNSDVPIDVVQWVAVTTW